ncbi:hypothetical protein SAMN05216276_107837 [Streptosporangium subroseum]|uniref:Uncharacterized protein n=1 Tax=Streptosporangium subroseum TaxID=106412 RepID=A0A239P0K6_9ACTN|nr:hypothetical protein [Streptosporangium subroseum]SNT60635.1 hypothetical protein SAMN05216276_107837 [Streptosporangium subroseum]
MTKNTRETIVCTCGCRGACTVDARSEVVHYANGNDPAARAVRHALVIGAANGSGEGRPL